MESYHVVATHPELLGYFSDVNSKYDVFGNLSRAISASGPPSPHTGLVLGHVFLSGQESFHEPKAHDQRTCLQAARRKSR